VFTLHRATLPIFALAKLPFSRQEEGKPDANWNMKRDEKREKKRRRRIRGK
jgi:hypothetical protein